MSEELITIEVDGKPLKARRGAMLIEVTDEHDIYVPRFCYHKALSIAANCRMCLVEVEKAPKPLPACATPVADGMKVRTQSELALDAQRSTMEFLLINHPLDCPICDQGGECELQDLAMGFGGDVSRYNEGKRVVKDQDIGPLVQTDMTRCIHCTRCVRFGEEIAGLQELGATGRGEDMRIGTYVARAMTSELSGNVIDVCPVGALTDKPYRYSARAWELRQRGSISGHDCVGSHVYYHVKGQVVKRAVPREAPTVNEVWLSDRDRYSCHGLQHGQRLTEPMLKEAGEWSVVPWDIALQHVAERLQRLADEHGAAQLGGVIAPTATVEEFYLLQKVLRGLDSHNIDHRLRQGDFSHADQMPSYPGLNRRLTQLEGVNAALLVGSYLRQEQPLANHRLRRAALAGARVCVVNPLNLPFNFPVAHNLTVAPDRLIPALLGILGALAEARQGELADATRQRLAPLSIEVGSQARAVAEVLSDADDAVVLLGAMAFSHPRFAALHNLTGVIASLSGARLGYLTDGPNSAGAWLAGAVPHRLAGGEQVAQPGLHLGAMQERGMKGLLLFGIEPELDCWDPAAALRMVDDAAFVVSATAFKSDVMMRYADVLLPIAATPENEGCFVNCEGQWQSFEAAVKAPVETRPAWKVLRVLGNRLGLSGFEYARVTQVLEEVRSLIPPAADHPVQWAFPEDVAEHADDSVQRITSMPQFSLDPLLRHSQPLQRAQAAWLGRVRINARLAAQLTLSDGDAVTVRQGGRPTHHWRVSVDDGVPDGCAYLPAADPGAVELGAWYGAVTLSAYRGGA